MNIILKYFLYLLTLIHLSLFVELNAQNKNWSIIDTRPGYDVHHINGHYYGLKCADSLNCMIWNEVAGDLGSKFRRTTDGGKSWMYVYSDSGYFIDFNHFKFVPKVQDISYPNTKLFIAAGDSGLIIRTTDNGETWEKSIINKQLTIDKITMFDENYGFLQSYFQDYTFCPMTTTDGGKSWTFYKDILGFGPPQEFLNRDVAYGISDIKGIGSVIIFSHDNYQKYDTISRPIYTYLVSFFDENNGWAAGGKKVFDSAGWTTYSQLIYRTKDKGKTWEKQWDTVVFNGEPIVDLRFYDKNFGICTSFLGQVVITTDGGEHWKSEVIDSFPKNDGSAHMVEYIQFLNSTTALVVEDNGLVYQYTREPTDVVEEINNNDFSITPNPVSDYLEISGYNHTLKGVVDIIVIYNVLGEIVTLPTLPERDGVRIDVSSFAPGIYFVRVGARVGKFVKVK